jgi:O-antigen/teichoic acid export membrane protein
VVGGEGVLNMYGAEFRQGRLILVILVGAALVQSYQLQFLNTMDALDRPELSFRVNFVFTVSNTTLNVTLVYLYGWIGAAFATFCSTLLAFVASYRILSTLLEFSALSTQILYQIISGVFMGVSVQALTIVLGASGLNTERFVPVLVSVAFCVVVYFGILLVISARFRRTVVYNLPGDHELQYR